MVLITESRGIQPVARAGSVTLAVEGRIIVLPHARVSSLLYRATLLAGFHQSLPRPSFVPPRILLAFAACDFSSSQAESIIGATSYRYFPFTTTRSA